MEKYYIGFDAGTQSIKVAIYNLDLECIAETSYPTHLYYPKKDWVEMNANEYLIGVKQGIRDCVKILEEKGHDVSKVRAIFGDGIICGIVGVNKKGEAITPYINYLDSRCQKDSEELAAKNLSIWAEETGNASPNCMFPAMIARWLLKNNETFQKEGVKFMHNAPYVLSHLAGLTAEESFIDWGSMSGWGLGYHIYDKKWSKKQLDILGISEKYMPKIVKPWQIIGKLTKEIAAFTKLPEGIPICAGAGDTMQSMLGCGLLDKNMAADVAGTCAMFCVSTDGVKPELSQKNTGLIFNSGTLENSYFYWGFIRTGGLALRWYRDNICAKESEEGYFGLLSQQAEKIPAGSHGVLFLPYLTGGVTGSNNACACFLNMSMDTKQSTLWKAVLEAIAYDYKGVLDVYRSAGVCLDQITITEGGSRSDLWNQIKADMLNTKVKTLERAGGALITNVLTAAYAVGDITNLKEELTRILKTKKLYSPFEKNTEYYSRVFPLRKELIENRLEKTFDLLREF